MISESDKLIKKLNEDRVVPCRLCGRDTPYIRMGMCTGCWEMDKGITVLISIDKKKAKEWLLEQLKSLE